MAQLIRCPGCLETYDPVLNDTPIVLNGVPAMFGQRFEAPDGKVYCDPNCFEENGN
jgi:hypothetical protein